jgi:hypothetical protein
MFVWVLGVCVVDGVAVLSDFWRTKHVVIMLGLRNCRNGTVGFTFRVSLCMLKEEIVNVALEKDAVVVPNEGSTGGKGDRAQSNDMGELKASILVQLLRAWYTP